MLTRNGRAFIAVAVVLIAFGAEFGYREFVALGLVAAACLLVAALWMANQPELQVDARDHTSESGRG